MYDMTFTFLVFKTPGCVLFTELSYYINSSVYRSSTNAEVMLLPLRSTVSVLCNPIF